MAPDAGLAFVHKNGFLAGGGGELAELGASELKESGRRGGAAETLKVSEDGKERGGRRDVRVEFHLYRDGVAEDGGGEVGREDEAKHGTRRRSCAGKRRSWQLLLR